MAAARTVAAAGSSGGLAGERGMWEDCLPPPLLPAPPWRSRSAGRSTYLTPGGLFTGA